MILAGAMEEPGLSRGVMDLVGVAGPLLGRWKCITYIYVDIRLELKILLYIYILF